MSNPTYYALQVIRVEGIRRKERDSTLYVEVKFDNAIRKTGTLSANAEPAWNGTVTFSCPHNDTGAFDVHLKKSRKRIGHVNINAAELLQESAESDVDNVVQIHPVVKVSWQIATALYRAVSEQLQIFGTQFPRPNGSSY
ncbi:hypothetical protein ACEPAH_185 [Sanghuangporus vaninii]